jgi:hypothetical protein
MEEKMRFVKKEDLPPRPCLKQGIVGSGRGWKQ